MTLVVSDEVKAQLSPRRSVPGTARPPMTEAAAKRTLAKLQHAVFEASAFGDTTHGKIYTRGLDHQEDAALRELGRSALALVEDFTPAAVRAADIEMLGAVEHFAHRAASKLDFFGAVVAVRGLEDGVRALHASTAYALRSTSGGWTTQVWLDRCPQVRVDRTDRLVSVRHALCAAEDAAYARAVAIAAPLREGLDPARRVALAFVFPDEPWANEEVAALHARDPKATAWYLRTALSDPAVVREELRRDVRMFAFGVLDLVYLLSAEELVASCAAALPALLAKPTYGALLKTPARLVAQAIACVRTEAAAAALAPYAAHPVLAPIVLAYFRDAPELAAAVTGRTASEAATGKAGAAIARVTEKRAQAPAAAAGEAPPVLRERPWRRPARDAGELARPEVVGLELERVDLPEPLAPEHLAFPVRDMTAAERAAWLADARRLRVDYVSVRAGNSWAFARIPDADAVAHWNSAERAWFAGSALHFVARHGVAVVPGFATGPWIDGVEYDGGGTLLDAAASLVSPRMAPVFARIAARRKRLRGRAQAWLARHAHVAALGLVPDAVGPDGEAKRDAQAALVFLAQRGDADAIRTAARRYGTEVSAAIEALLDRDPLELGVKAPKRPACVRVADLPPVALATREIIDDDARDALVEVLQISPVAPPYPGLALVRAACDPASLAAFALELLEQWVVADAHGRHEWMLFACIHFPSDASERRIAELARGWARSRQDKAQRACAALAALGTDVALTQLARIAETTRFDALRRTAATLLADAADARGLTADELADRTVPDAGLGRDGMLALSFGTRAFVVALDELLQPIVFDVTGGERRSLGHALPRATKTDDAASAKAARARFTALVKDVAAVADGERRRLERAMIDGRAWTLADLRERVLGHPLDVHLARRLVWIAQTPDGARAFRIAEDATFADVADDAVTFPDDARVWLAHPAREPAHVAGWGRVFADYELVQPFEQLARAVHAIAPDERDAEQLARIAGIGAPARKLLGMLEARGFRRDNPGSVAAFVRSVRGLAGEALVARLPLSPGFDIEGLAHASEQTTGAATLTDGTSRPLPFGALDATSFSELVRDISALRSITSSQ